ncbi:hypothetical protein ACHWQZ_G014069 [Mnemiopsis leidyi]
MVTSLLLLAILGSTAGIRTEKVGVLLMHGFWQAFDTQHHLDFKDFVEGKTGVKVHLIDAFNDLAAPPTESSLTPMWIQVPAILEQVKNISAQYEKIIAVGFSQGGVIWRAMIESWDNHNVDTFISLASPQHGISDIPVKYLEPLPKHSIPSTLSYSYKLGISSGIKEVLKSLFYLPRVQNVFAPSNYFLEPKLRHLYLQTAFFPRLNNEVGSAEEKQRQKNNFQSLRKLLLIGGPDDGTVIPWQSQIFGFRTADKKIVPMEETQFYKDDLFGLKTLDEKGAITTCIKGGLRHSDFPNSSEVLNDCVLPAIQDVISN